MVKNQKVVVVLPAYNAAKTLLKTYSEIPLDIVDEVILVDDASSDDTVAVAGLLGIEFIVHDSNKGYGANQKTAYQAALKCGADIIIMLHPDYQYPPSLIGTMAWHLAAGNSHIILGSRILGGKTMQGGMPLYKYVSNRLLTFSQNILTGAKLSEYHTGYRGYTRQLLQTLCWQTNSDDFIFDNQFLCQAIYAGYAIDEITSPARYFKEASSINFYRSVRYGLGCLYYGGLFRLNKWGWLRSQIFKKYSIVTGEVELVPPPCTTHSANSLMIPSK